MRRVNQDHPRNFISIPAGKHANVVAAHGMSDENIRRRNSRSLEKRVQFLSNDLARAWPQTGITIADPGAVIGANLSELRNLWLHLFPRDEGIAEAGIEHDPRRSLPAAVYVHVPGGPAGCDLDTLPRHRTEPSVVSLTDVLVYNPTERKKYEDGQQSKHNPTPERSPDGCRCVARHVHRSQAAPHCRSGVSLRHST
jgi:hypothetical protein